MTVFAQLRTDAGISVEDLAKQIGYSQRTVYRWENGEIEPRKTVVDFLKSRAVKTGDPKKPKFRFIDLFAGIGGMRIGFENVGGECVFTSEWDDYCALTYRANFNCWNHRFAGDITQVKESDIPEHDVLLAGFPCQPFSIAGVSKKNSLGRAHGFADKTQGTLFFDVARIIAHHKPAAFLLENVKNLLNHDKGRTFETIKNVLEKELGYHIDYKVINASGFVPQKRERIFIAGFRENTEFSFDEVDIPAIETGPKLGSILHSGTIDPQFTDPKGKVLDKYTLSDKLWKYLQDYAAKHKKKGNGFGFGLCGKNDVARTLSARYYKDGSEILVRQTGKNPRRLTPRECARLMGFDSNGRVYKIPVSDTRAYKQFGNAVVVPIVEAVVKGMLPHIETVVGDQEPAASYKNYSEPVLTHG